MLRKFKLIEPVEFGAISGRKKQIQKIEFGKNSKGEYWVEGSHDGYESYGASYKRTLFLKCNNFTFQNS